jgi:hypothetical protein
MCQFSAIGHSPRQAPLPGPVQCWAKSHKNNVATAVTRQYIWDMRYIDAPVLRDEHRNSHGDCTDPAHGIQAQNPGSLRAQYENGNMSPIEQRIEQ